MKDIILATLLLASAAAVVVGVTLISTPAGWIVAGPLLAGWSLLVLTEVSTSAEADE